MPSRIIGITDPDSHQARHLWPIGADVYKGSAKRQTNNGKEYAGENLPYFRVVFRKGYEQFEPAFRALYGEQPKRFENVRLAGSTDEAFPTGMAEFSSNHSLVRTCNLQTIDLQWGANGYEHVNLPCLRDSETPCACGWRGRLWFYLPDLMLKTGQPFQFELGTGDHREMRDITTHLDWVMGMVGSLSLIPFTLYRDEVEETRPMQKDGKTIRARVMNYPVILLADMTKLPQQRVITAPGPGEPAILPPANFDGKAWGPQSLPAPDDDFPNELDTGESAFGHPPGYTAEQHEGPATVTLPDWWQYLEQLVRVRLDTSMEPILAAYECDGPAEWIERFPTLNDSRAAIGAEIMRSHMPLRVFEVIVKPLKDNPANHCYVMDTGFGWATAFERKVFVEGHVIQKGAWAKEGTYKPKESFWVFVEGKHKLEADGSTTQYWQVFEATMNPDAPNDAVDDRPFDDIPF